MRRLPFALLIALPLLGCPKAVDAASPTAPTAPGLPADTARLHITGSAVVQLPANRARVSFGVETEGATASEAAARNAERAEAVLAALRAHVGPEDQIETRGFSVQPRYRDSREAPSGVEIVSYRVVNSVVLVTEAVDAIGAVLDVALEAGANRIDQFAFFAEVTPEQRGEAIEAATERARREAEATARALGMQLGPVVEVRTSVGGGPGSPFGGAMRFQAESVATPIEAGSDRVTASVSIIWTLVDPTP